MTKEKAVSILKKQLDSSVEVSSYTELDDWHKLTKEYIGRIYGVDSIQYKKFRYYKSLPMSPYESIVSDLKSTLHAYSDVIENTGLPTPVNSSVEHDKNNNSIYKLEKLNDMKTKLEIPGLIVSTLVGLFYLLEQIRKFL